MSLITYLSDKFDTLVAKKANAVATFCDERCKNGYDNDGSNGFDIFEGGLLLAAKAAEENKKIFAYVNEGWETTYFFLANNENEILALAKEWGEDTEEEEES